MNKFSYLLITILLMAVVGLVVYLFTANRLVAPTEVSEIDAQNQQGPIPIDEEIFNELPAPPGATLPQVGEAFSHPLVDTHWNWERTDGPGRSVLTFPPVPNPFVLRFSDTSSMSSATDCNSMSGSYKIDGNTLTFGPIASTKMFCENSLESPYMEQLSQVGAYSLSSSELRLTLQNNAGVMIFTRVAN